MIVENRYTLLQYRTEMSSTVKKDNLSLKHTIVPKRPIKKHHSNCFLRTTSDKRIVNPRERVNKALHAYDVSLNEKR